MLRRRVPCRRQDKRVQEAKRSPEQPWPACFLAGEQVHASGDGTGWCAKLVPRRRTRAAATRGSKAGPGPCSRRQTRAGAGNRGARGTVSETLRRCLPDALRLLVPESPRVWLTSSSSPLASTIVDLAPFGWWRKSTVYTEKHCLC